jgi:hypothetical protein
MRRAVEADADGRAGRLLTMIGAAPIFQIGAQRTAPGVYHPPDHEFHIARWRINGHRALIFIWTVDEWERLADRPTDAQYYPCGVWCALRME